MLNYEFEKEFRDAGYKIICGADEAGRGPLCGPVIAAACILPDGFVLDGLDDSKKLSPKKRDKLYDKITAEALCWAIGSVSNVEIDEINILNASMLAMRRAIESLTVKPDFALIDGNVIRNIPIEAKAIVSGDAISPSIAAASIIAKVTRDRICTELDEMYPGYGIAKHKGYPTKDHYKAIFEQGPSPCHRMTFLKNLSKHEKSD